MGTRLTRSASAIGFGFSSRPPAHRRQDGTGATDGVVAGRKASPKVTTEVCCCRRFRTAGVSTKPAASPSRGRHRLPTCISTSGRGAGLPSSGRSGNRALGRRRPRHSLGSSPSLSTLARSHRTDCASTSTQQPGSKTFRAMTAVAYYAGLRPSEVVMLRVRSAVLPAHGWGRLDVTEADISFDEPGEPKTGPRNVPIPPALVAILRGWIATNQLTSPDRLLFRTRNDTRPSGSNWARAWHRALQSVGQKPMRVYDCRHAAATTWLRAGMPLAEIARRLGHSVEHSSPPTSAPSTTKNTPPTNASTPTSNQHPLRAGRRPLPTEPQRRLRSAELRNGPHPRRRASTACVTPDRLCCG